MGIETYSREHSNWPASRIGVLFEETVKQDFNDSVPRSLGRRGHGLQSGMVALCGACM